MVDLDTIWQDYGLDKLQQGIESLFPEYHISLSGLLQELLEGDVLGAMMHFLEGILSGMGLRLAGMKDLLIWLLVLGIVSALLSHFVSVLDKKQIAELSFYFVYLLLIVVLLKSFSKSLQMTYDTIKNIILFIKLLLPTYLLAVGVASGTTTVGACYQLILLLIYGVEQVLSGVVLSLIYSYLMLAVVNGIWLEEKLTLLMELLAKGIGWILKAALGVVTGISVLQAVITPAIDSVKGSVLQKVLSAIPGIGNAADGVVELVAGSAVLIKNSVGIVLLILLLVLCAAPLLQLFLTAVLFKGAAAFLGVVSDKRITACTNATGEAGMMLFRTAGTAMLLFLISISIVAATTNRGF